MPSVILVNTFESKNLGSVSRILLNFGISDLRLVAPECNHLSEDARRLAVNSVELLESAKIFPTLKEAIADLQFVAATTSRSRNANSKALPPATAAQAVITSANFYPPADSDTAIVALAFASGIVFGPEKNGLNNLDLGLCNAVINIDTFERYPVLNLAQSVNCIGYELWKRKLAIERLRASDAGTAAKEAGAAAADGDPDLGLARQADLDFFVARLERVLQDKGGLELGESSAQSRGLQSIYKRAGVTAKELQMLQGMITALSR